MSELYKLPFGPTTIGNPVAPEVKTKVDAIIEIREQVYEAQSELLDGHRNQAARCLDTAMVRVDDAVYAEALTEDKAEDLRDVIETLRIDVSAAPRDDAVKRLKDCREGLLDLALSLVEGLS